MKLNYNNLEITEFNMTSDDKFVIVASDGVFEYVTD